MNTANLYIRMRNAINADLAFDFTEVSFMSDRLLDNWNYSEVKAMMHFKNELDRFVVA